MGTRCTAFMIIALMAATVLTGCEHFVMMHFGDVEPPEGLRVEEPSKPPAMGKVGVPETKTAICPECAERMKKPEPPVVAVPAKAALADIYFDYDKYDIRPGDAEILRKNVEWFKANPGKRVRVEGYCDERGTGSYNVALGQNRAEAAKGYLVSLGLDERLFETVTMGKERPGTPGHNKEVWANNRRVHFEPVQ